MKFSVLSSGSKGNSTYLATSKIKILIDVGMSCLYIENALNNLDIRPREINGIIITHTHSDHINGLKVFIKKYQTKLYITKGIYQDLKKELNSFDYEIVDKEFDLCDLNIKIIKTSHDAPDSNGYILKSSQSSLAYITDTGYINRKYFPLLKNQDYYIIESNHDVKLLMDSRYPYYIKQRILGDKGHLSNEVSSNYLSKFIGEKTKGVILIHLSEENNRVEIAKETLENTLLENNLKQIDITISEQYKHTNLVEI